MKSRNVPCEEIAVAKVKHFIYFQGYKTLPIHKKHISMPHKTLKEYWLGYLNSVSITEDEMSPAQLRIVKTTFYTGFARALSLITDPNVLEMPQEEFNAMLIGLHREIHDFILIENKELIKKAKEYLDQNPDVLDTRNYKDYPL